jgi:hypothetical protein
MDAVPYPVRTRHGESICSENAGDREHSWEGVGIGRVGGLHLDGLQGGDKSPGPTIRKQGPCVGTHYKPGCPVSLLLLIRKKCSTCRPQDRLTEGLPGWALQWWRASSSDKHSVGKAPCLGLAGFTQPHSLTRVRFPMSRTGIPLVSAYSLLLPSSTLFSLEFVFFSYKVLLSPALAQGPKDTLTPAPGYPGPSWSFLATGAEPTHMSVFLVCALNMVKPFSWEPYLLSIPHPPIKLLPSEQRHEINPPPLVPTVGQHRLQFSVLLPVLPCPPTRTLRASLRLERLSQSAIPPAVRRPVLFICHCLCPGQQVP